MFGFTVVDDWNLLRVILTVLAVTVWVGVFLHEL